jgi:hypothetical protein
MYLIPARACLIRFDPEVGADMREFGGFMECY